MNIPKLKNGYLRKRNQTNPSHHDIWIYGRFGMDVNVDKLIKDLEKAQDSEQVNFYIHSPGGYVDEGYVMITHLNRLKEATQVHMNIDGMAYSMGSVFSQIAHKRVASSTSKMMIHDPWFTLDVWEGMNRHDIDRFIEYLQNEKADLDGDADIMAGIFAQNTGLSVDQVKEQWFDGFNHYFTPSQMLEAGLIDEVAVGEMPKPPAQEEVEEEDQFFMIMMDSAKNNSLKPGYRGAGENYFRKVAIDSGIYNSKPINKPEHGSQKQSQKTNNDMDEFLKRMASKLNLEGKKESEIHSAIESGLNRVQSLEAEVARKDDLISQFKTDQTNNEKKINDLQSELKTTKVGTVVSEVIDEVEGKANGQEVNVNVREKLNELADDYLEAQMNSDEKRLANVKDHMVLICKNNLIPVGQNKNLKSDDPERKETSSGDGLSVEGLKKAQAKGEKKRKKLHKA